MFCIKCGGTEENVPYCSSCGASTNTTLSEREVPRTRSQHLLYIGITDIVMGLLIAFFGIMDMREILTIRNTPWMTFRYTTPDIIANGAYFWWVIILGVAIAGAGLVTVIYRKSRKKATLIIAQYAILLVAAVVFLFVTGLEAAQFLHATTWYWVRVIGLVAFPAFGVFAGIMLKNRS